MEGDLRSKPISFQNSCISSYFKGNMDAQLKKNVKEKVFFTTTATILRLKKLKQHERALRSIRQFVWQRGNEGPDGLSGVTVSK